MDRNLARKNIRTGLIVARVCFFMFGMTVRGRAAIYVSMSPLDPEHPARRRGDPPPRPVLPAGRCWRSASRSRSSASRRPGSLVRRRRSSLLAVTSSAGSATRAARSTSSVHDDH